MEESMFQEWMSTHDSNEIVAKVSGEEIIYDSYDNQSYEDKSSELFNEVILILANRVKIYF